MHISQLMSRTKYICAAWHTLLAWQAWRVFYESIRYEVFDDPIRPTASDLATPGNGMAASISQFQTARRLPSAVYRGRSHRAIDRTGCDHAGRSVDASRNSEGAVMSKHTGPLVDAVRALRRAANLLETISGNTLMFSDADRQQIISNVETQIDFAQVRIANEKDKS